MAQPLLHIEMFGSLRVLLPGKAPVEMPPHQVEALLAYLALHPGRQHTREELVALFWPEEAPETARHRLRTALHTLRRHLEQPPFEAGSILLTTRTTVWLNSALVRTDVGAFLEAIRLAEKTEEPAARIGPLARAVEIYRGELLPGYYQDGFLSEQQRLADLYWSALNQLRQAYEEAGDPEHALECARRVVKHDPLSEQAHCALMRLYAQTGQPSAMLRQFQELKRTLKEQLDLEPSVETYTLLEALRQNGKQQSASESRPVETNNPTAHRDPPHREAEEPAAYSSASPMTPSPTPLAPVSTNRASLRWRWAALGAMLLILNGLFLGGMYLRFRSGEKPAQASQASMTTTTLQPPLQISPRRVWRYPRASDEMDSEPTAMAVDAAGNVYITGFVQTTEHDIDFLTLKVDPNGNLLWRKRYNGTGNDVDRARSLALDNEGNVVVTGESDNGKGNGSTRLSGLDYVTIKYDGKTGKELWARRYNGDDDGEDWPQKAGVDPHGNVYITGYSRVRHSRTGKPGVQCLTLKYSPAGALLWARPYVGEGGEDYAYDLTVDADGNVYLAGSTRNAVGKKMDMDFLTVKYDTNGAQQWVHFLDGSGHGDDKATCIRSDSTGKIYVGGTAYDGDINNRGTDDDFYLVVYSPDGKQLFQSPCAGEYNSRDLLHAMAVKDGEVFFTGETLMPGRSLDIMTSRIKCDKTQPKFQRYNGPTGHADAGLAITVDPAGNVLVTGKTYDDVFGVGACYDVITIKYAADTFLPIWNSRYNGPSNVDDIPVAIACDRQGNAYVAARSGGEKTFDIVLLMYPSSP